MALSKDRLVRRLCRMLVRVCMGSASVGRYDREWDRWQTLTPEQQTSEMRARLRELNESLEKLEAAK